MASIPITLIIAIAAVFIGVLVVVAASSNAVLERRAPERQRLRQLTNPTLDQPLIKQDKALVVN